VTFKLIVTKTVVYMLNLIAPVSDRENRSAKLALLQSVKLDDSSLSYIMYVNLFTSIEKR
jgi:hypothetical protein